MKYLSLLRENPEYAKLWFAQVISLTGDWFNTVVLLGLVSQYSEGSGIAISIFLVLRVLPPLLVGPFAGVLLDRFNRRNLLVASNLLRALIVPLYLLGASPDTLWIIYSVTIVQFTLSAIFEPGQSAIIPALVKPEYIVQGNTLMSVTWSVMLAAGAIVGGIFAYIFGATAAIIADALTFAVAGGLLLWVDYDPTRGRKLAKQFDVEPIQEEDTSFLEGIRYIRQTPQIAAAIFIKFGQSFGNVDTLMTIFATQLFIIGERGELSLAILWSTFGLGAILGPAITNNFSDESVKRLRRLVGVGFALIMVGWILLGVANTLLFVSIAILFRGMGGSINWTYSNIIIQKTAPDAKLGRMFSIDMVGFYFATVVSTLVTGWLIDTLGTDHIYWIVAGTGVVALIPALIWAWAVPALERMEDNQRKQQIPVAGD